MPAKTIEIYGANANETFTKTRVGCRGIVIKDARILISHEVNTDYFLIPGGGLEEGETPEDCVVREVLEETGYIVKPVCRFLTINEYYGAYKYVGHCFLCEIVGEGAQNLTALEAERGLVPEWIDINEMLDMYSKYESFAEANEEKCGGYLREYTTLREYLSQFGKD